MSIDSVSAHDLVAFARLRNSRNGVLSPVGACTRYNPSVLNVVGERTNLGATCLILLVLERVEPDGIRTGARFFKHDSPEDERAPDFQSTLHVAPTKRAEGDIWPHECESDQQRQTTPLQLLERHDERKRGLPSGPSKLSHV